MCVSVVFIKFRMFSARCLQIFFLLFFSLSSYLDFFYTYVGVLNSVSQALFIFPYSSFSVFFNLHNLYQFIFKFTDSSANSNLLLSHSIEFLILLICNSQLQNFHLVTFNNFCLLTFSIWWDIVSLSSFALNMFLWVLWTLNADHWMYET